MKAHREPLQPGRLDFDTDGTPASSRYGDVYHSRAGALAQAAHVFIRGNGLPDRWAGRASFTVCESGFGLGNNFLALWQAWRASPVRPGQLHMLSFEAHPFSRADLATALSGHTGELREMADALLRAWPVLVAGLHRLEFEGGRLTLTLAFGRVEYLARQVEASVDAFFLDGFSPARNPAMWSRSLFGQLVRIANVGATAATWCSAGQVRRDLSAAGFLVSREPGFGGKRQMSTAVLRPGLGRPLRGATRDEVLVVGGGLAGAGIAYSLAWRGHRVTVLDPVFEYGPAGSHHGHRCAAMTPALSRDDNPMSRLSRAGILLAYQRWNGLAGVMNSCGSLLHIDADETPRWQQALNELAFPSDWMHWCSPDAAARRCGLPLLEQGGIWLAYGAQVWPQRLLQALLTHDRIRLQTARVSRLRQRIQAWEAVSEDGTVLHRAPRAVVAAAADSYGLLKTALPQGEWPKLEQTQRMGGQVGFFQQQALLQNQALQAPLKAIVAGAGYFLPGDDGIHVGGSTYLFDSPISQPTNAGFQEVAHKVAALLDGDARAFMASRARPDGWAGWRAAVSDHLPVVGPVDADQSLWVACAYGSRGLSWMTLAGEIMAAALNDEPQVVERELLRALRPR